MEWKKIEKVVIDMTFKMRRILIETFDYKWLNGHHLLLYWNNMSKVKIGDFVVNTWPQWTKTLPQYQLLVFNLFDDCNHVLVRLLYFFFSQRLWMIWYWIHRCVTNEEEANTCGYFESIELSLKLRCSLNMPQFNYNNYYQRQRQSKKKHIITIERIWRRESWKRSATRLKSCNDSNLFVFQFQCTVFLTIIDLVSLDFVPFDSIAMCVVSQMELMRRYFVFSIKFSNVW